MAYQSDDETSGYRGPSPSPDEAPPRSERHWIDRPADLAAVSHALLDAAALAIDVEFVAARPTDSSPTPRLALIQIAEDERCYVIDALRLANLDALNEPFRHPDVLKIFHGLGSDVRVLRARGVEVAHVLDLEAVSRAIFGQHESGLQAMLQRACGVRIDKTLQRSDWTQRPLPSAMFAYAARDAEMTLALFGWLHRHFRWAVDAYEERPGDPAPADLVAPWLAAFLVGERSFPPELADDADPAVLAQECAEALLVLARPTWRARVLRAAADLVLTDGAPLAVAALQAASAEERAAAARALGRLRAVAARAALTTALADPVLDVRRAAAQALEQIDLPPRPSRFGRADSAGGESLAASSQADGDDSPWKALLRDLFPPEA